MSSRRTVLKGVAGLGTTAIAGCSGATALGLGRSESPVTILAAGSLTTALERGLPTATDHPIRIGTRGSAAVARLVAADTRSPNIVSLADPVLFDGPLHPSWYAEFATNAMVLAYNTATPGGRAIRDADHWWEPILDGTARLGRTDPTLDPLGYRTLFTLELASTYYASAPPLRNQIPTGNQVYPETQLLAQFETGGIDAAFTYRNMAIERDYDYRPLPAPIDLSDPSYSDRYHAASYTLPSGKTVAGDVIRYAATIHRGVADPRVRAVFETHIAGDYLDAFGFDRPAEYPTFVGDVPKRLRG